MTDGNSRYRGRTGRLSERTGMIWTKKKKGIRLLVLTVLLSALFAFSVFGDENLDLKDWWHLIVNNTIVCDIEEYPACQNFGVNEIFDELAKNYDVNVKKFNNRDLCIAGVIKSMNSNGSSMELTDITGGTKTVTVRASKKEKQALAAQFNVGDRVRVFGKAGVSKILKVSVTLQLNDIEKTSQTQNKSSDIFSFASGREFDRRDSEKRSFHNGAIEFLIPNKWTAVETEISGTGMNGWMYKLNEIQTEYKTEPEQAYVFFFDNETGLKNITDRDASPKDIERAIIRNIMDKDLNEQKSVKTADGYKFTYYLGNYKDNSGKYHNVEFIFTELDTRGVMGVLYIYNESNHKEDIIYMMRTIVKK